MVVNKFKKCYVFHNLRQFYYRCLQVTSHFLYSAVLILTVGFHCFLSTLEPVQVREMEF